MKSLVGQSAIYAIAEFLPRVIGFGLLPLYTRFLSVEDYGVLAVLDMVGVYFGIVVNAGFSSAMMRYYHEREERGWHARVFITSLSVAFGLGLLAVALTLPVSAPGSLLLFGDEGFALLLAMVVASVALEVCNSLVLTLFRLREDPGWYLGDAVLRLLIAVPLNVVFIAVLRMGILGFVLSNLITAAAMLVTVGFYWIWRYRARPDVSLGKELLRFAAPFIPTGLLEAFVNNLGVLALTMTGNLAAVGLFGVGHKIGSIVSYAYSPIGAVWVPHMFKIARRPDAPKVYARAVTVLSVLLGALVVALCVFGREILALMTTDQFQGASAVVFPLALGSMFFVLRPTVRIGLSLARRTGLIPVATVIPAALGFPLTLFLAREQGAAGAAWGVAAVMVGVVALTARLSQRFVAIPYERSRLARVAAALGACCALGLALPEGWYLAKLGVLVLYPALLILLQVPTIDERRALSAWVRAPRLGRS